MCRRESGRSAADDGGAPPFRLQREFGHHHAAPPRERHAGAAMTIVVDHQLVIQALGAEHEPGRAMRAQADRRPDDAIPRHAHRREVARRPRPRLTIAERTGWQCPAAAQAKAGQREGAGLDRRSSVDEASLVWESRGFLTIVAVTAAVLRRVRSLAGSRRQQSQ